MRLEHETLGELDARAWELLEPWDVRPDNATVERLAVYTFAARHATQWRQGRVLLAGDAAHQMPPFAGQGMCAGIRDVTNLAWKLDLVLRGQASDDLLDSYTQERLPSAREAIEFSVELGKVICVPDPVEAAERDAAMIPGLGPDPTDAPPLPPIAAGIIDPESPHAGTLFVQGVDGADRFDDIHGTGWRLITIGDEPVDLDPATAEWFSTIGGRIVRVPTDGVYGDWFTEHHATAALQRPDFHLYGTATSPDGAAALIERLTTTLANRPTPEGVPT